MGSNELNNKIYELVHSNKTYSEIVDIARPLMETLLDKGSPQTPETKVLHSMCGYFGYEGSKYNFWNGKTRIGQQYKKRIAADTRFSDVLSWLERDANGLRSEEERRLVLTVLRHHKGKLRENRSDRESEMTSDQDAYQLQDDIPSIQWVEDLVRKRKKEGKVGPRGGVQEHVLKAEIEARYYRAQGKIPHHGWWEKIRVKLQTKKGG